MKSFPAYFLLLVALFYANSLFAQSLVARKNACEIAYSAQYPRSNSLDTSLTSLGFWGLGPCNGAAVMGQYILTASGSRLLWIDATDPRHPILEWDTLMEGSLSEFTIEDSIGYALLGSSGFVIIDFRNPHSPSILSHLEIGGGLFRLVVERPLAFAKRLHGGLFCIDIADLRMPFLRPTIYCGVDWGAMAITNHHLFIGDQYRRCHLDVSNPDSITITDVSAFLPTFNYPRARDTILVVDDSNWLEVFSIANPDRPVRLSYTPISTPPIGWIDLKGDTVFVGAFYDTIVGLDISNRYNPSVLGSFSPPEFKREQWVPAFDAQDSMLYCTYPDGLTIVSAARIPSMEVLSSFPTGQENVKVSVSKGTAFITSGIGGLWRPMSLTRITHGKGGTSGPWAMLWILRWIRTRHLCQSTTHRWKVALISGMVFCQSILRTPIRFMSSIASQ
jgi:hypothetical protein